LNITVTDANITDWNASDGYYNLTVSANDGSGWSSNSSVRHFRIDTVEPSFSNNKTNASSTTYNGTDVQLNLTIADSGAGIDFYRLLTNDTSNGVWINESIVEVGGSGDYLMIWNYSIHNFSVNGGIFAWRGWTNDSSGNINLSNIYTLTVQKAPDTAAPVINNLNIIPQKALNGTNINISVNVTDVSSNVSFVKALLYYPNGSNFQNLTMDNSSTTMYNVSYTVDFTPAGTYNVTLKATNSYGSTPLTKTISPEVIMPSISLNKLLIASGKKQIF